MAADGAVTTVVARRVRPERRDDHEDWSRRLLVDAATLDGYLGAAVATLALDAWPHPVRSAVVIAVEIALMTYVLLPWLTRRPGRWIFPPSTRS